MTDISADDDLRATIARVRREASYSDRYGYGRTPVENADLTAILDAAERAANARNAALEEAARVAEAVDPEKPTTWLHPRHKIAFAIRALKEPT